MCLGMEAWLSNYQVGQLSSTHRTNVVEGEKWHPQVVLRLLHLCTCTKSCKFTCTQTHTLLIKKKFSNLAKNPFVLVTFVCNLQLTVLIIPLIKLHVHLKIKSANFKLFLCKNMVNTHVFYFWVYDINKLLFIFHNLIHTSNVCEVLMTGFKCLGQLLHIRC